MDESPAQTLQSRWQWGIQAFIGLVKPPKSPSMLWGKGIHKSNSNKSIRGADGANDIDHVDGASQL